MPCQVSAASSGSSTWKLNDTIPATTIITSGMRRLGVRRTYASAARSWPGERGTRSPRWSSAGSISRSAVTITRNVAAFTAKHADTPNSAISAPAAAGPTIRAECTSTEFSATALTTRSGPTISITNAWRAGLSIAVTRPASEHERVDHPRLDLAPGGEPPERDAPAAPCTAA